VTGPDTSAYNTAEDGAYVGIQANQVIDSVVYLGSTVYQTSPDDLPHRRYEIGLQYLKDGVPVRARELIGEAITRGHENGEVRFHWALAMLSKRSYRDLAAGEREQLRRMRAALPAYADDAWKHALEAVCDLVDCLGSRADPDLTLKTLNDVPPSQRELIDRHLDLVLTGGMKDGLWFRTRQEAEENRRGENRDGRVWAYFEPIPAGARIREPAANSATPGDWVRAIGASSLLALAVGYLGWASLLLARPLPIVAYVLALAAGVVAARSGYERRYLKKRLKLDDGRGDTGRSQERRAAPAGGFANSVDRSFDYYFNKYMPTGIEREVWLEAVAGVRGDLRDEIIEIYREQRVSVGQINWLIRFLVIEVRGNWLAGDIRGDFERRRAARVAGVRDMVARAVFLATAFGVLFALVPAHPFTACVAALAAVLSGRAAAARWLHIVGERRRVREEREENEQSRARREAAYERWKAKLDEARPDESEMEYWLYCDKTALLGRVLSHYRLAWRDVIAYAFLQVPAKSCKRARVKHGPWRYSRYDVRLFLVTRDGVREIDVELDFGNCAFHREKRTDYRFEAVSSVHVATTGAYSYTLELTLMNGPTRSIRVTEPEAGPPEPDEDPEELARINLDATGFAHALHILEGIAAEGKGWRGWDAQIGGFESAA
jgi:hypothetical protein